MIDNLVYKDFNRYKICTSKFTKHHW